MSAIHQMLSSAIRVAREHSSECDCTWKEPNRKNRQHRTCCLHDEPGLTICTCGGRPLTEEQT